MHLDSNSHFSDIKAGMHATLKLHEPLLHANVNAASCPFESVRNIVHFDAYAHHIYSCPVLSRTTGLFDIPAMDCNTVSLRVLCIQVKRIRQVEN